MESSEPQLKVLLIGDGGVGKSTFMKVLQGKEFEGSYIGSFFIFYLN